MELKILGSGTCVPSLKRHSPSNHLKIADKQILIDCGPGTLLQLEKANLSYKEIDIVCISHYHNDHISDLNALIWALNWTPGYHRKRILTLVGPIGFKKYYDSHIKPISGTPHPGTYKINILEIEKKIDFNNFTIESYKTDHTEESIAYKFSENGKILVISSDTDYDKDLIKFSENSDVLILECSYPNNRKVKGHLVSKECGKIAKEANVKKLILTHLYPISSEETRLKETKKFFQETILAEDLLKIDV